MVEHTIQRTVTSIESRVPDTGALGSTYRAMMYAEPEATSQVITAALRFSILVRERVGIVNTD